MKEEFTYERIILSQGSRERGFEAVSLDLEESDPGQHRLVGQFRIQEREIRDPEFNIEVILQHNLPEGYSIPLGYTLPEATLRVHKAEPEGEYYSPEAWDEEANVWIWKPGAVFNIITEAKSLGFKSDPHRTIICHINELPGKKHAKK